MTEPLDEGKESPPAPKSPADAGTVARELHWLEKLNIAGQMSLVIVGIVAASIYGCQLTVMRRQLDQMSKQYPEIQKSALAASNAAKAAQDSLAQNEQHFRLDERPYLWETSKTTEGPRWIPNRLDDTKGQVSWNWHMTNYGKSPANNIRFTQEMKLYGHPWQLCFSEHGEDSSPPELSGSELFDTVLSQTISSNEFKKLMETNRGISIRIKLHYTGLDGTGYETGISMTRTDFGSVTYPHEGNYIK